MTLVQDEIANFVEDILNTINESLIVLDPNLKIVYANNKFFEQFKVNKNDTLDKFIYDLGNKQWNIPKLKKLIEEILPQKKIFENFEVKHTFESIGEKVMLLNGREVVNRLNGDRLMLISIEDITEKKKLLEYTIQKGRLSTIGQLSAGIAHGLTSPLTGIQNILNIYFEEAEKGGKQYKELKLMLEACDYMNGIVKNLVQFANREKTLFKDINLVEVIESVLLFTERQLLANNIEVVKDYPKNLGEVKGIKSDLQHTFLNIILNAKDSIKNRGKIIIKGEQKDDNIIIEIRDNGEGIVQEDIEHVFTPFFTTKGDLGGVGLGLSSAYGMITKHNGQIILESKKEEGTKVIITLPVAK